jgi:solute carrier family 25 (mitochondrial adenine nucleotide translocator), member 4/5/6/31
MRGLYTGFTIGFISIFLYRGLYFGIYDFGKKAVLTHGNFPINLDSSIITKLIWAQVSVIIAEQLSYPGDTVKRKLFMQVCKS